MKPTLLAFTLSFIGMTLLAQPVISFQPLATTLSQPLDIATDNDGRLFIVEKAGTIRIWDGSAILPAPFLDITSLVRSSGFEQGLLSLAFHPNYATNGYFFVYYTNLDGDVVVARYERSTATTANPSSGVTLMTIYQPFANHNGGKMLFGPDGYLYFGTGDGGSGGDPGNRAQNGDSILGKMIRIDVNNPNPPYYSIPPTNPYIGNAAVRDDIIALGLRNPWRWSFDKQTGDMWIADVGQGQWEEVNFVPANAILDKNYGWRCFEGNHVYDATCQAQPNNVFPVFEYPHNSTTGGSSVTGGYRYRGSEYSFLQGYYLVVDYISGNGWLLYPDGSGGWNSTQQTWMTGISSFGEDEDGNLYVVRLNNGTLYKILASDPLPVKLVSFTGNESGHHHQLQFTVQNETAGETYTIEKRTNAADLFEPIFTTRANADRQQNTYKINLPVTHSFTQYRLAILSSDNRKHFSHVITFTSRGEQVVKALAEAGNLRIFHPEGSKHLKLFDATGKLLQSNRLLPLALQTTVPLAGLPKGVLFIMVETNSRRFTTSIVR